LSKAVLTAEASLDNPRFAAGRNMFEQLEVSQTKLKLKHNKRSKYSERV
jgi:hypothetical protein